MINPDELRTTVATVGAAPANIGTAVPQNMRRYIYRIKATNIFAGVNLLTLSKQENGVVLAPIDYVQSVLFGDVFPDPDELKEDSAPLYIVEGGGAGGASYLRAVATAASVLLTFWYVDKPA